MRALLLPASVLALLFSLVAARAAADPTEAEVAEQAQRLDPKNSKAVRLDALSWFNRNSRFEQTAQAVPALTRCIKEDPDGEVRQQAVLDLALIENRRGQPCPLVIVEVLSDEVDEVRWQAAECIAIFKTFAPGAAPVLLRHVKSLRPAVRGSSLLVLARAADKDEKAIRAIRDAMKDEDGDVRRTAHCALFVVTDSLAEFLPYLARVHADTDEGLAPDVKHKLPIEQRNLIKLGGAMRMCEWLEKRPKEVGEVLGQLLDSKDASTRRDTAVFLRRMAEICPHIQAPPPFSRPFDFSGQPPKEVPKPENEKPPVKAVDRLRELGIAERLRQLQARDPDAAVQTAAREALQQLAAADKKEKP